MDMTKKLIEKIKGLKIEQVCVDEIRPDPHNPKYHPEEQIRSIAEAIARFGWTNPILLDEKKVIIAGHGRLAAAQLLNMPEVPCIFIHGLDEAEKSQLLIYDNRIAEDSSWLAEQVGWHLKRLNELGADLSHTGMSDEEVSGYLDYISSLIDEDTENSDDEVPPPPKDPQTKRGDRWIVGRHVLLCGDATDNGDMGALMCGDEADLLLTDPPYNVNIEGKAGKIQNDDMSSEDFATFVDKAMEMASYELRPGAAFYVWHGENVGAEFRSACAKFEMSVRQVLIWRKNAATIGRQDYQWQHEPCLYGWKDGAAHYFTDDRTQSTVLDYPKPRENALHPTMKPVAIFERLILNSTLRDQIVLDPFGGSGTSMIATERTGRICRMMEIDPRYCDVIVRRYLEKFGGTAKKQDGSEFKLEE